MNEQSVIIAKMCQECVNLTHDRCEGKTREGTQPGKKPCKRYRFDENLLSGEEITSIEFMQQEEKEMLEQLSKLNNVQTIPPTVKTPKDFKTLHNQDKADKFTRLSAKRLDATLDSIRKLSNLANPYVYQWTEQQAEHIAIELKKATDKLIIDLGYGFTE